MSRWNPDDIPQRCAECDSRIMTEFREWLLEKEESDRLASLDPTTLPGHAWASDREYREHMDEVAPLACLSELGPDGQPGHLWASRN